MGIVILWIMCAAVSAGIGHAKNRTSDGVVLGLLLGVVGVVIIAVLPTKPLPSPAPGQPWPAPNKWHRQPAPSKRGYRS